MSAGALEPRIFISHPLETGTILTLAPGPARHLVQVLRRRVGDPLQLFNGEGSEYRAEITMIGREAVTLAVGPCLRQEPPSPLAIHLLLGVSRGERMEVAIQKAVELGVDRLTAVWTQRVQFRLDRSREAKRLDHWWGIITSACEQSGRCRLPPLEAAANLQGALAFCDAAPRWWLDPEAEQPLTAQPPPGSGLTLLIGPEGGFDPRERDLALSAGFVPLHLGPRVLRTETAPLAALAAIQTLWGDLAAGSSD